MFVVSTICFFKEITKCLTYGTINIKCERKALPMNYIDLHVHSNMSDGTLSPSEVVIAASKRNLAAIALTDHDTVNGVDEAISTAKQLLADGINIKIIPGTEISVAYENRDIHMLGLLLDHKNTYFRTALDRVVIERNNRNEKMIDNLRGAGIDISMDVLKNAYGSSVLTRAHIANYLMNRGYVKTMKDAFNHYLSEDGPYYVPRKYVSPEDAIHLIKSAGGLPILAHPLLYNLSLSKLDALVFRLKDCGLVGIETIYHANTGFDESNVRKLANKYDLLITGGSDFHGDNKPDIQIGTGRGNLKIPYSILEDLQDYKNRHLI